MTPSPQSTLLVPEITGDFAAWTAIDTEFHRLLIELDNDPWDLPLPQRDRVARASDRAQREWLPRVTALVEPPAPTDDFPAFLLELPRFRELKNEILGHSSAGAGPALPIGVADQLQRFVDLYRHWLTEPSFQPA